METLSLDGLPLRDPQGRWFWDRETGLRIRPSFLTGAATLPGRDGTLASKSTFTAGAMLLSLIACGDTPAEMDENTSLLLGLLSQRHKLMPLVHDFGGRIREAKAEVNGSVEPRRMDARTAQLLIPLSFPSVFWRDLATVDAPALVTGTTASTTLTALAGTTGTINDALIRFKGGFTTATITDPVSGDSITINQALTSTEYLIVDCATWTARKVTTDTWVGGTNVITNVVSNRGSGPMLTLNPDFTTGAGRVRLTVKGNSPTTSPTVTVRARRSFL